MTYDEDIIETPELDKETSVYENLYAECNRPLYRELRRLRDEYKADCVINLMNLGDKTMLVPSIKQKWVGRMCKYENTLKDIEKLLKAEIAKISDDIQNSATVKLTKAAIEREAANGQYPKVAIIKERFDLIERIISQCDHIVNKHIRYLNDEIRSIIEMQKLETL